MIKNNEKIMWIKEKVTTRYECTRLLNGPMSKQDASLNPAPDKYNWTKFHFKFTKANRLLI